MIASSVMPANRLPLMSTSASGVRPGWPNQGVPSLLGEPTARTIVSLDSAFGFSECSSHVLSIHAGHVHPVCSGRLWIEPSVFE